MKTDDYCKSGLNLTPEKSAELINAIEFLLANCGPASMRYQSQRERYIDAVNICESLKSESNFVPRFNIVKYKKKFMTVQYKGYYL